jgi:NADH:ubiquinone reductase (H+-translocating)
MSTFQTTPESASGHRVVVIGGGFGGLRVVERLRRAPVRVTLIDRRNFHLFQPLTYQVATGALSPGQVARPLRTVFKSAPNVDVLMTEVAGFDLEGRRVLLASVPGVQAPESLPYDTLVVAAGSSYSYFGHEDWREYATEVKTLESAVLTRSRILRAFERAELTTDPATRAAEMTFVVVGAGPTGVEMAGQLAELARDTLRRDFRMIDPRQAQVVLLDAGDRVLPTFPPSLSAKATRSLEALGVTPIMNRNVVGIDGLSVTVEESDGSHERIPTRTVVWAAGVTASGLGGRLGGLAGGELDKAGRLTVERDLTLAGHPEVIVLGDMVRVRDAKGNPVVLPGVAPVAIQQGNYAGTLIHNRLMGRRTPPFRYHDKGNLATIGRGEAVADLHLIRLSGSLAWWVWLFVHLWYLIGFRNRLLVTIQWSISFFTHGRSERVIGEMAAFEPVPEPAAGPETRRGDAAVEPATPG